MATLTWLGHASFRIDTDDGKRIYVDPFLQNNPKTPDGEKEPERVDIIAVTHGHGDHAGEMPALSKQFPDAEIVAQVELKGWLGQQGANVGELPGINKGGTQEIDGIKFTLTNAFHSRAPTPDGSYTGEACGLVVRARRQVALLRGRHVRVRRHAADRAPLQARRRGAADRRLVHDGPGGGRARARAARQPALRAVPLGHLRRS